MLEVGTKPRFRGHDDDANDTPSLTEVFESIIGIVKRQFPLIIICIACTTSLGLLYLFFTPPKFMATTTMVIDTKKVQLFPQQSVTSDVSQLDAGAVGTEIEILKSENVSRSVAKSLNLIHDQEFVGPGSGLFIDAMRYFSKIFGAQEDVTSEDELERRASQAVAARETITRVGTTYAIEIGFKSLSPTKAASIANAIADAYIMDQLESKYQATKRASVWLQDRIKELRGQASNAERAVVEFKHDNNIVQTGGQLINERQMEEGNSQLMIAHAATAEAKARLDRIQDVIASPFSNASVADELKNDIIVKLRQTYLDLIGRRDLLLAKVGPSHLAVIALNGQIAEVKLNIVDEMKKLSQTYKSDYDIAVAREMSLKQSLANVVSDSKVTDRAQILLRELETNSETYRTLYTNFMQRYMEAVQQQSWPFTEARVITPASPGAKSDPKTTLILAMTAFGGLMISFCVAGLKEISDRVFRTTRKVEDVLQVNCLATIPLLRAGDRRISPSKSAETFARKSSAGDVRRTDNGRNLALRPQDLFRFSVASPLSRFTESIRSLKVAVDLSAGTPATKVIGVTSTLPREGKTTLAANFAFHIAHTGGRVLVVDLDLRNPSLSRMMTPGDCAGVADVVCDKAKFADCCWTDQDTGLVFLPAGATSKLIHTNEILSSEAMIRLFQDVRRSFDYVIVDLPPLAPVVDVRVTTKLLDNYLYVVEWGKTPIDFVKQNLAGAQEVYDRLLGVVLNKADLNKLGRYDSYKGKYYYKKHYSRYGYVE